MSDTIRVGDRVQWVRQFDGKAFEGTVLEVHLTHARVQPLDAPDSRMWPWLHGLTSLTDLTRIDDSAPEQAAPGDLRRACDADDYELMTGLAGSLGGTEFA